MFQKKCGEGFILQNNKCIRKNLNNNSCSVDGKHYCKQGDKPLKPPIARPGGKSQIADKIIEKAPLHKTYVEPFVGGGCSLS